MEYIDLAGKWKVTLEDGKSYDAIFPGTLDENRIGHRDAYKSKLYQDETYTENASLAGSEVIATRLTRKYTYEGKAEFTRVCDGEAPGREDTCIETSGKVATCCELSDSEERNKEVNCDKRLFLEAERSRALELYIDGKKVPALRGTLSTPYTFEITDVFSKGSEIKLVSDNSYKELPHDDILYSSAATDETQTNWNGILGHLRIRIEEETFIERIFISAYDKATVKVYVNSLKGFSGRLTLESEAFEIPTEMAISVESGVTELIFADIPLKSDAKKWDEYQGNLYSLRALLTSDDGNSSVKEVAFGCRKFGDDGNGHLALNDRRIFLRSEANCCVFPETGHAPTDAESWTNIINTYKSYGINCLRFHSHCPPDAAFRAADELGVLIQPELSHWNPSNAFGSSKSREYYTKELREIITEYGNHPSFVMLTFGNELQADEDGLEFMHGLLKLCHELDDTRLYAIGSNVFYGEKGCDKESDFYTSCSFKDLPLRATFSGMQGYLNNEYPSAQKNYDDAMRQLRKEYSGPVFSFEVGQYEVLPDFDEINDFKGVTSPDNFELIRDKAKDKGLLDGWKKRVEATGELSLLCYREEVLAALSTEDFSGISLLGLQDFPGQGTALVGMLNSHLDSKPFSFADPERFNCFFRPVLPLVLLPKYTYTDKEHIVAEVKLANYSGKDITGSMSYFLIERFDGKKGDSKGDGPKANEDGLLESSEKIDSYLSGESRKCEYTDKNVVVCEKGKLSSVGTIDIDLSFISENTRFDLEVSFDGHKNKYPIWVYAEAAIKPQKPDSIYETAVLDDKALEVLEKGGKVYLSPDSTKEDIPDSIKSTFSTDFWSVGTFATQEGSMGLLIDEGHPLFKHFPTSFFTEFQWWPMASQRAFILKDNVKSIVTVMDSYAYMRNMGQILEFQCRNGKVLASSIGLQNLQQYPECRALLTSIYEYMDSDEFDPSQELE